ncbi:MAG TPA: hypothetical protein VKQ27_14640 [Acetobacteraceae bacterium]|nr:hypothetical protein [Acetobacteraceae bacterium]
MNLPLWSVRFLGSPYASARVAAPDRATACLIIAAETGVEISAMRDDPRPIGQRTAPVGVVTACGRIETDHAGILALVKRP